MPSSVSVPSIVPYDRMLLLADLLGENSVRYRRKRLLSYSVRDLQRAVL